MAGEFGWPVGSRNILGYFFGPLEGREVCTDPGRANRRAWHVGMLCHLDEMAISHVLCRCTAMNAWRKRSSIAGAREGDSLLPKLRN